MTEADLAAELVAGLRAQWPAHVTLGGFEVEVGELLDLDVAALTQALRRAVPDVEVRVVRTEGLLQCQDCGARYPADESPCPVCGSAHAEPVAGLELSVRRAWARA